MAKQAKRKVTVLEPHRWLATVVYRTDSGPVDVPHALAELEDLHQLVESGPHWDTVIRIEIARINHTDSPTLTIEQSMEL